MRYLRGIQRLLALAAVVGALLLSGNDAPTALASPDGVTVRWPAFGLPHIYADTDLELARENGRQIARDRLGQLIMVSRVARGTLAQAFAIVNPGTVNDDILVRRTGYTSSELNSMFEKLPASEQAQVLEYARGVNDTIDAIYAGALPEPLELRLLRVNLGLRADIFGNATNISDQVDPYYLPPGGADPERPNAGFQFTPELVMAIATLQVRSFGSIGINESTLLDQMNALVAKFPADGQDIWSDLNFLNDPLTPVSVPDPSTPGFGGPLSFQQSTNVYVGSFPPYDYSRALAPLEELERRREERARALGAWPALGSYAWMIDGSRSATGNPWIGGFPQTGIQTPSIMHFVDQRSGEGTSNRISAAGMAFVGSPIVLIGQTDNVAYTSTTAINRNNDQYIEKLILEETDVLRYNDEGTPAPMSMRTEKVLGANPQQVVVWRTHERAGNGGTRTIDAFVGDASGKVDSASSTTLTDSGAFGGAGYAGGYVAIIAGAGAGQMRAISSNTRHTLTLASPWTITPNSTSEYVAARAGNDLVALSRERTFWMEESTTALGFSLFQRAESILDIRRGARLMPSSHNFMAADNQPFNGIGTDLGAGGNIGYWSAGFWRVRQGSPPTDPRLPLDGAAPNPFVVVGGTLTSAGPSSLTATGAFVGRDFTPPGFNFRLNNPSLRGSEYIVTITGGDGYRQTRRIAANDDDTLTLEEPWGAVPSPGDLFEVYEVYAMAEAINPPQGYSANWNNKAATADDSPFGRENRSSFILERLLADSSWTRVEQRQLNADLAGLDSNGKLGRYLIPRLREAVDGVGNGGNPQVDTVLAQLEAHNGAPFFGRKFVDPVTATTSTGHVSFLYNLINRLSTAIYGDELSGTGVSPPTGVAGLHAVQHAIDSAAGSPPGRYQQQYAGDYFNGIDWRIVVRDAFSQTIADTGGIPPDSARGNDTFVHPLSALFPSLVFEPTPTGNRGVWEQIVEVGPTVKGEFVFPLGQSGFIDVFGNPDPHFTSLHQVWHGWQFVPILRVSLDLDLDPDGDVDNDGVFDAFERWYYGDTSPAAVSDSDGDGATLIEEFLRGSDPTHRDTDRDGVVDGAEIACGGDPIAIARRPERVDGPFAGVDDDKDGQVDEALPPGAGARDCDGDGYRGEVEDYVYSYRPQTGGDRKVCQEYDASFPDPRQSANPSLRWPADLSSSGVSANRINLLDLSSYLAPVRYLNTNIGANPGDVRWDLVQSAVGDDINLIDLANITTVKPPMFLGPRAFNGPACPWPP